MTSYQNHQNPGQKAPSSKAFMLSRDPNKAMEETIRTIENLQDVYERETKSLLASDTRSFLAIQDEKLAAARQYQSSVEEIIKRKEEMRDVPAAMKQQLRKMQEDFTSMAHTNLDSLSRMQRTVGRLGNTIRRAAQDVAREKRTYSYGDTGEIDNNHKKSISMGVIETA